MSVTIKALPAIRIAELTATAASYSPQDISPVIQPLYPELLARLTAAGVRPAGSELAWYEPVPGRSGAVRVHAAVPVAGPDPHRDFAVLSLPPVACAATILHHGSMDEVIGSLWTAAGWIEDHGYRLTAYHREVYLDYDPARAHAGLTELQLPIVRI